MEIYWLMSFLFMFASLLSITILKLHFTLDFGIYMSFDIIRNQLCKDLKVH